MNLNSLQKLFVLVFITSWVRESYPLIQKAANSNIAFNKNKALNGIGLASNLHLTGHKIYSNKIRQILDLYNAQNLNLSTDETYDFVTGLTGYIREITTNNSTFNSGQIAALINYP